MIIVKLMGGLGNQLFQYALGKHLSVINRTDLKLDRSFLDEGSGCTPRSYALEPFHIKADFTSKQEIETLINNESKNIFRYLKPYYRKFQIIEKRPGFDKHILAIGNHHYLEGYWQSEQYFSDIESSIRQDLQFTKKAAISALKIADQMQQSTAVGLHIRRGDYVSLEKVANKHGLLPASYYKKAIEKVCALVHDPVFFIFSDDIDWVKTNMTFTNNPYYVSNSSLKDWEELWLMSQCKHMITANSSFSWWGAWLIQNKKKIIIAPKPWFKDSLADPKDIIPPSWTKITAFQ